MRERKTIGRGLGAAAAATLAVGLGWAGNAAALPDLVIVEEDTSITFESCEENLPLATGLVAIKNIGDSRARLPLGVLSRFSRSLVAVYVPEHLDMIDNSVERSVLDARDQESIRISVGRNVQKRGRFPGTGGIIAGSDPFGSGGGFASGGGTGRYTGQPGGSGGFGGAGLDRNAAVLVSNLTLDDRREIQRALRDAGHYSGPIDGQFDNDMDRAIRSFQRRSDNQSTRGADGRLTVAQIGELSTLTGRTLAVDVANTGFVGSGADRFTGSGGYTGQPVGGRQAVNRTVGGGVVEITLFAVVDPYNLVEESDETNNLVKFTGTIDCR